MADLQNFKNELCDIVNILRSSLPICDNLEIREFMHKSDQFIKKIVLSVNMKDSLEVMQHLKILVQSFAEVQ
jgi:hypothetical protein